MCDNCFITAALMDKVANLLAVFAVKTKPKLAKCWQNWLLPAYG
jgi:hypothetical protein